jgi:outer membrane receptor for ferrienterochelin and colicin
MAFGTLVTRSSRPRRRSSNRTRPPITKSTYFSQSVNGFPVNGTINGPSARSRGFEAATRLNITKGLSASFATSYTKAKWSDTKTICLYTDGSECRTYAEGGLLGGAPRWKHTGNVRYARQLRPEMEGFLSLHGRYVGKVQIDRADDPNTTVEAFPSYALFDARAGFNWRNLDVTLWVENIADGRSRVSQQFDRVLGGRLFFTRPRTYGLNLSYAF